MIVLLPALLAVHTARADENITAIRSELDALKTQYETRIQALEQRLNAAEQQLAQEQKREQEQTSIEPARTDYARADYAPVGNSYAASSNQYNPAMGIILNGALRTYEHDPKEHSSPASRQAEKRDWRIGA